MRVPLRATGRREDDLAPHRVHRARSLAEGVEELVTLVKSSCTRSSTRPASPAAYPVLITSSTRRRLIRCDNSSECPVNNRTGTYSCPDPACNGQVAPLTGRQSFLTSPSSFRLNTLLVATPCTDLAFRSSAHSSAPPPARAPTRGSSPPLLHAPPPPANPPWHATKKRRNRCSTASAKRKPRNSVSRRGRTGDRALRRVVRT